MKRRPRPWLGDVERLLQKPILPRPPATTNFYRDLLTRRDALVRADTPLHLLSSFG